MERNKPGPRSGKSKIGIPHTSELFALGSKTSISNRDDAKNKVISTSKDHRKREASTSTSTLSTSAGTSSLSSGLYSLPSKKCKLSQSASSLSNIGGVISSSGGNCGGSGICASGSGPRSSENIGSNSNSSSSSVILDYWEQVSIECDPIDLITKVLAAIELQDSDTVVGLICGSVKLLISIRTKPDTMLNLSLLYLAKLRPHLFCNETITSALIAALKRDPNILNHSNITNKLRNSQQFLILIVNLLSRGYHNKQQWPEQFLRLFIEDAINERAWIDFEDCSSFVDNICTAFGTHTPPKSLLQPELNAMTAIPTSASTSASLTISMNSLSSISQSNINKDVISNCTDDDSGSGGAGTGGGISGGCTENNESNDNSNTTQLAFGTDITNSSESIKVDCGIQPRFSHCLSVVEKIVLDAIKEQLNRRQASEGLTRNFFKFLSSVCGLVEVRAIIISRLEIWIHNPKLARYAQELLTFVFFNVTPNISRDHEVMAHLVRIRMKSKPIINIYMLCLKEIITLKPEILNVLLKLVVQNELSTARNSNNMGMLASIFQTKPEESAVHLAEIYQEFLLQRDDCLRTLRVFLRELVKVLRYDIKLFSFCKSFLQFPQFFMAALETCEYRDRILYSMVDLICLSMLLCVSPQIREANNLIRSGRGSENRISNVLIEFYDQMSRLQCEIIQWIYQVIPNVFKSNEMEYTLSINKILMLETPDVYTKGDQWPLEPERSALIRMVAEVPLQQESIVYVILIGMTKEIPFKVPDAMELIEQIIRRAANLKIVDYPVLHANKLEIIDFLFSMAAYRHPENIVLPVGYEPPKLAITSLYWKTWNILLLLSAHNPSTFGEFCYNQYPQLVNLMELCITNQFNMVKPIDAELQLSSLEKQQILEFESHLAAATSKVIITELNSLLLSQLMLMDPMGCARRPPNHILEMLQSQNVTHKLGHLLCRSRKPDLLLDIIQRYGTSQSMPWLTDLVQNSESDFNHLPIQCLCEFLLTISNQNQLQQQHQQLNVENPRDMELLIYLQNVITDKNRDSQSTYELLEYFLRRLSSTSKQNRLYTIRALRLLLRVFDTDNNKQLIENDMKSMASNIDYMESDWLLRSLPLIEHFNIVRYIIILQLRAACQIENNPYLVMTYIQFIAANTIHDTALIMLEHMMDMSQLIVERSTLFSFIIPNDENNLIFACNTSNIDAKHQQQNFMYNEVRLQTLNCLFIMYNNFLIKIRDSNLDWSEYTDLIEIHFSDGTKLPIHLNIVQAFIILLTYSTMIPNSQPNLDYWFPLGGSTPKAYLKGNTTTEQIQILPDWLKLKVIRSSVDRLVDAVLQDLTPDQIILFLQNFGTPVNSMSKLLALLDRAVIEQFDAVKTAIMNKEYLAQLIEIQQARGAKNGHIAVQALELHGKILTEPIEYEINVTKTLIIDLDKYNSQQTIDQIELQQQLPFSCTKEIDEVVEMIVTQSPNSLTTFNAMRIRNLMQQLIAKDISIKHLSVKLQTLFGKLKSMQQYTTTKVLQCLFRMAKGLHGSYYFQNICQTSSVYSLFRSLLTWLPPAIGGDADDVNEEIDNSSFLIQVIDECIQKMNNPNSNPILFQMLLNKRKNFIKQETKIQSSQLSLEPNKNNVEQQLIQQQSDKDLKELLKETMPIDMEYKGKHLLNEYYKKFNSSYLIDSIINVLKSIELIKPEMNEKQYYFNVLNSKIGILVDWLADIDSELVVSACSNHQLDLLFYGSFRQFRFYLLSLLSHQANWTTLHMTINKLFKNFNPLYDPTSVIHFIGAIIHNPKLWQGRDKATSKHEQIEYVLKMNISQIQIFSDYIIKECSITNNTVTAATSASSIVKVSASTIITNTPTNLKSNNINNNMNLINSDVEKLNSRIQLLLHVINPDKINLIKLVNYIREHPTANESLKRKFLQQLYINIPPMRFLINDFSDIYLSDATSLIGCEADKISNYTITIISSLLTLKDYQTMSQEIELLLRKLAASHPSLILRQLSVLTALLQGRADMDIHVLRNNYHISLFNQVIGIIELLQPHVFDEPYKNALHQVLDCYFTLLKCHGHAKDISLLMFRFMELLQSYINQNANRALTFIEPYADLMQYLASNNRNMIPLQQIVHGVTLLKHKTTHKFIEQTPTPTSIKTNDDIMVDSSSILSSASLLTTATLLSTTATSTKTGISSTTTITSDATIASTSIAATAPSASTTAAQTLAIATSSTSHLSETTDSTGGVAAVILAPYSKQIFTPQHWPQLINIVLRHNDDEILSALQEIEMITLKRNGLLEPIFDRILELLESTLSSVRGIAHILLVRHLKHNPGNVQVNSNALISYLKCLRNNNTMIGESALETLTDIVICLQEYAPDILRTAFDLFIQSKLQTFEQMRKCILTLKLQHGC